MANRRKEIMVNRTVEQWLAYGDDLPVELARVFTLKKKRQHNFISNPNGKSGTLLDYCSKCHKEAPTLKGDMYPYLKSHHAFVDSGCSVPDPIKIDWNTAMAWFRKTSTDYPEEVICAMVEIFLHEIDDDRNNADRMISLLKKKDLEANGLRGYFTKPNPNTT